MKSEMTILVLILSCFSILGLSANCSIKNCVVCPSDTCYACQEGYYLRDNACNPICDQYCANCTSPGICAGCVTDATLNSSTNICQLNCGIGFRTRCKTCSNLYFCKECTPTYFLTNNSRVCSSVQNCGQNCLSCSTNNNNATCLSCVRGYRTQKNGSSSTCIRDICYIAYCAQCATVSTCSLCARGFQLSSDLSACIPLCNTAQCFLCSNVSTCLACNVGYNLVSSRCIAVCSIKNCSICLSSSTCLLCSSGYALSTYGKSCELSCNDQYCSKCSSQTICSSCKFGYGLSDGKCLRSCMPGYTANVQNACVKCSANISSCSKCFVNGEDVYTCIQCQIGYYVNQSDKCSACNISNCIACKSQSNCSVCSYGYILSSIGSCLSNCSVSNCQNCSNSSICDNCSQGFTLNSDKTCIVSCQSGKFLINGVCSCPLGSYSNDVSCVACPDYKCLNCTVSICSSCMKGYYASNALCLSCINDCLECSDSTSCSVCNTNYIFYNGKCTYFGNGFAGVSNGVSSIYTCPAGCDSCSFGVNNILGCTVLTPGYSFSVSNLIKCDSLCFSCAKQSICLTCYPGYVLVGQKCVSCLDSNAYSCSSTGLNFSLSCRPGYTPVFNKTESQCKSCANNCFNCDINGAGYCDPGRCQLGYVQIVGSKSCTPCLQNCPVCSQSDPSYCISCGSRRYANYKGLCKACQTGCKDCVSSTECTNCMPGFILDNLLCKQSPTWPCSFGSSSNCTLCVKQYTLLNGKCNYNSSCTSNSQCTSCAYGYYLVLSHQSTTGKCVLCSNLSQIGNCLTCDPLNITKCFLCKDGYYVQNGKCVICQTGCKTCSSKLFCVQAAQGYYLLTNYDGSSSGKIQKCSSPCSTCDINKNYCLTCISGYAINGSTCFSSKAVYYTIVFNQPRIFDSDDSFQVSYGKLLNNIGQFKSQMCTNLPQRVKLNDSTCQNCLSFLKFSEGSISLLTAINANDYKNFSQAVNDIKSKSLVPDGSVLSTSASSYGIYDQTPQPAYQYKAGLILAIVIPISFLGLMIVITIIYCIRTRKSHSEINLISSKKNLDSGNPSSGNLIKQ